MVLVVFGWFLVIFAWFWRRGQVRSSPKTPIFKLAQNLLHVFFVP